MSGIYLSLIGLYEWDPSILDGMTVPAGVDRDVLKTKLLSETAELELLYQNPVIMKELIRAWAVSMRQPWERMMLALTSEYNPLHNYDRTEEWTDERQRAGNSSSTSGNTQTTTVNGWDTAATEADRDKVVDSGSGTVETAEEENAVRRGRTFGNIGVTTSMTMLREEIEGRNKYNIYDLIVEDFKSRFCLMVY